MTKKMLMIVFTVFLIILIMISIIIRLFFSPSPPSEGLVVGERKMTEFKFNYDKFQLPNQLEVFQAGELTNSQEMTSKLIGLYGLAQSPLVENIFISDDNLRYLRKNEDGSIAFYNTIPKYLDQVPQKENAKRNIAEFLQQINPYSTSDANYLSQDIQRVSFSEGESLVSDKGNAYYYEEIQKLNDIDLFLSTQSYKPYQVWTNLSGEIIRANFYPTTKEFVKISSRPSLSWEEIENNLLLGKGSFILINATDPFSIPASETNLISSILSRANLEYRINEKSGLIYPYIRFYGQSVNEDGDIYNIEIILPAIHTQD